MKFFFTDVYKVLLLFILPATFFAQNTFEKTYSTVDDDRFFDVCILSDTTIVHVGVQRTLGDTSTHSFIIRTNKLGDTLWTKILVDTLPEKLRSVTESSDKSIVAAGTINSDFYLVKLNKAGQVKWRKAYALPEWQEVSKVIACKDKGFLMAGTTMTLGIQNPSYTAESAYLVKTDSVGNILWTKIFSRRVNTILSVLELPAGDIIATGCVDKQDTTDGVLLCRLSSAGTLKWARSFSDSTWWGSISEGRSLAVSPSGDIYITGLHENSMLVMRTDSSGNLMWAKNYKWTGYRGMSIQFTKDQHLLLCFEMFSSFRDIGLFKMNLWGDTVWAKIHGQPNIDFPQKAVECPGGGYLMIANRAINNKGIHNLLVIKTNTYGVACFQERPLLVVDTPEYIVAPLSFTFGTGGSMYNLPYTIKGGLSIQTTCSYNPPPIVTRVDAIEKRENLRVFPNPVSALLTVESDGEEIVQCEMINILGKISARLYAEDNRIQINCMDLEDGYYITRIFTRENKIIQYPIIVSH